MTVASINEEGERQMHKESEESAKKRQSHIAGSREARAHARGICLEKSCKLSETAQRTARDTLAQRNHLARANIPTR